MRKIYKYTLLKCAVLLALSISVNAQVNRTLVFRPSAGSDDAEETVAGGSGTVGQMDLGSSDLELMTDGTKKQTIGIRFTNISVPQGAIIQSAFIQFATKGDKNATSGIITISAHDTDNSATFTSTSGNISGRTKVSNTVNWAGSTSSTWGTSNAGLAGTNQRTPDLKTVIQQVISRSGWASGNALSVILTGEGVRNAYSFDGSSSDLNLIPTLILTFQTNDASIPTTSFPIAKNSIWKFLDNGSDQGTAWTALNFNDDTWNAGAGKLGYSDHPVTTLSFGADANNKYITYYFRKKFNITNVNTLSSNLELNLLRDDAAIVYINGTEVLRDNLPATGVNYLTNSSSIIDGTAESTYTSFIVPTSVLQNGDNIIAVEVHQRDGTSSDLGFDLELKEGPLNQTPVVCNPAPANFISDFISVLPSSQPDSLRIPSTHSFQMLLQSGSPYSDAANGNVKSAFDFTGYAPIAGSSENGYLSVNHEGGNTSSAGVSMLDINYNNTSKLWQVTNSAPIDFLGIQGTARNCSGAVTPWGTIITAEESLPSGDANTDGYQDIGWLVEIDPVTRKIMDYDNNGTPDKIWKAGRMSHENAVVAADLKTLYEGNDENPGYVFKYVASAVRNLSDGELFVLKLNGSLGSSTSGTWIQVPNSTPTECNNVKNFAASVGATNFDSVEDVEIGTIDNMIYFTSKASSRVYRFSDDGTTVSNFSVFVGNSSTQYAITHSGGTVNESWGSGNDNLTFDQEGNLYVIQDGSRNHIWMVRPCHTQQSPKVELFAVTPAGSEPTGMTFSPDNKFMFLSIQHPSSSNSTIMKDAAGNNVRFNRESAIVIARKEFLGIPGTLPITFTSFEVSKSGLRAAQLKWQFTTDQENVNFEVERMTDGNTFKTLKSINNEKTTKGLNDYVYVDEFPALGKNYYRIKSTDSNGKIEYTPVKVIDVGLNNEELLVIYPNPVADVLHLKLNSTEEEKVVLEIINQNGQVLLKSNESVKKGENQLDVNVSQLSSGVYIINLHGSSERKSKTFIKN